MLPNQHKGELNRFRLYLIALTIFSICYVRFFTEKLVILPRIFQLMDFGVISFLTFILFAWLIKGKKLEGGGLGLLSLFYLLSLMVSTITNFEYVEIKHFISFIFLQLEGVIVFWFIINSNFDFKQTLEIVKWIFWTGIIQIIVSLFQIPSSFKVSPDLVSGTFGFNYSQMISFLVVFSFAIFGSYIYDRRKIFIYLLPFIIIIFLAASFRAVWLSFPITLIMLWFISSNYGKGKIIILPALISFAILYSFGSHFANESSGFSKFLKFEYNVKDLGKVRAFIATYYMFADYPGKIFFGTGPGTYGSRTYRTFGAGSDPRVNPTAGLITVQDRSPYMRKYLYPAIGNAPMQFGSTIDSGYTSYNSNLGETGIFGFILFFSIYGIALKNCYAIHKKSLTNVYLFSLSLASIGAIIFIAQMALNDDWFGVSRVTVPIWMFIALTYRLNKLLKTEKEDESTIITRNLTAVPNTTFQ